MAHHAIYINNPTAGAKDGTKISSGTGTQPLKATLDSSQSETVVLKCAVRCDDGYKIESDTTISFIGDSSNKWAVAEDDDYENATIAAQMCDWQSEITLESVTSVNKTFWVKVTSSGENPSNDTSVTIQAAGQSSKG